MASRVTERLGGGEADAAVDWKTVIKNCVEVSRFRNRVGGQNRVKRHAGKRWKLVATALHKRWAHRHVTGFSFL